MSNAEICALRMPNNYVILSDDEMEYLDGGMYLSRSTVQGLVMAIAGSTNPASVSAVVTAVKWSSAFVACKLGAVLGPIGWAIGGTLAAYVVSQAWTVGERLFSAIVRGKGVDFTIGWQWGVIPVIEGTLR